MATLGDILGSARRSAATFEIWAEAADPELAEAVKTGAIADGGVLGGYTRMAVADLSRFGDEEGRGPVHRTMRDSDDP